MIKEKFLEFMHKCYAQEISSWPEDRWQVFLGSNFTGTELKIAEEYLKGLFANGILKVFVGEENGKTYYKITPKGYSILKKDELPDIEE